MDAFESCYQCKERFPGCHSTCPKYIKEKKEWEISKAKIEKDKAAVLTPRDFNRIARNKR